MKINKKICFPSQCLQLYLSMGQMDDPYPTPPIPFILEYFWVTPLVIRLNVILTFTTHAPLK